MVGCKSWLKEIIDQLYYFFETVSSIPKEVLEKKGGGKSFPPYSLFKFCCNYSFLQSRP